MPPRADIFGPRRPLAERPAHRHARAMAAEIRVPLPDTPDSAAAIAIVRTLRDAGHGAYLVGGCVRDLLLGLRPKDYDVATAAEPPQVIALFSHVIEVGVAFGVVRVRHAGRKGGILQEIEVATFRADVSYSDGRRPDTVVFTDAREDVLRRDFTLNGLLLDPLDCTEQGCRVVDWVGGIADLTAGLLRAIGEPAQRFEEDALRMLRAPRFAARFGLRLDPATTDAVQRLAPTLHRVSQERINAEIAAMLTAPTAPDAVRLLDRLCLAPEMWPDLALADPHLAGTAVAFEQLAAQRDLPAHDFAFAPTRDVPWCLALAVLLWPVRARHPALVLTESWHLARHDGHALAAIWRLAEALLTPPPPGPARIRLLRDPWADAALRLLLARFPEYADAARWSALREERARTPVTTWQPAPWVTGDDLIALGHAPGPNFRAALMAAEDVQLTGGSAEEALASAIRALRPMVS